MVRLSSWNLYMKFVMANFAIVQVDKDENLGYILFSCFYEDYDALEILYLMANFAIVRVNKEEIGDFFFSCFNSVSDCEWISCKSDCLGLEFFKKRWNPSGF